MSDRPPFRRYETLSGVEYEVLSSKGNCYYTVILLAGIAISCQCENGQVVQRYHLNQKCKHKILAETEEAKLQEPEEPPEGHTIVGVGNLNDTRLGFSMLK